MRDGQWRTKALHLQHIPVKNKTFTALFGHCLLDCYKNTTALRHRKENLKLFTQITPWIRKSSIPPMAFPSDKGHGALGRGEQAGLLMPCPLKAPAYTLAALPHSTQSLLSEGGLRSPGPPNYELQTQNSVLWLMAALLLDPQAFRVSLFVPCIDNFIAFFSSWPRSKNSLKLRLLSPHNINTLKTSEILARLRKGDTFKSVHTTASAVCSLANTADGRMKGAREGRAEAQLAF